MARRAVNLRFDPDLWERIKEQAARENRTATNWLEMAARSAMDGVRVEFDCPCGRTHIITRKGGQTIVTQAPGPHEV